MSKALLTISTYSYYCEFSPALSGDLPAAGPICICGICVVEGNINENQHTLIFVNVLLNIFIFLVALSVSFYFSFHILHNSILLCRWPIT